MVAATIAGAISASVLILLVFIGSFFSLQPGAARQVDTARLTGFLPNSCDGPAAAEYS
jgi:hypothetical protein